MSGTLKSRIVKIDFEQSDATGRIYATSKDVQGLLIGRRTMSELKAALPGAIEELYAACGVHVVVTEAQRGNSDVDLSEWVAMPAEAAQRALSHASA